MSDKFEHNDENFRSFIGYKDDNIVRPLCVILPQMSGYIKYSEKEGINMSFIIKDDCVLIKYNKIWHKIKEIKSIKFHSMPVYDKKYIKAKVREFNGVIKTNFLSEEVPKEGVHYTCIACITIDSIIKMRKKNYPQFFLEECRYKIKKTKMSEFIDTQLESDSSSDSE